MDERRATRDEILVWLPSPLGDAVLCTPALRAIRRYFKASRIWFLAEPVAEEMLSPCGFNDAWVQRRSSNPFAIAKMLSARKFSRVVLFKNSFGSALSAFLARIPSRIGYAREGRAFLLTDKLYPDELPGGGFKPGSMIDYYLAIAAELGADTADKSLELAIDPQADESLHTKLPEITESQGPIVVIVPGGAFGLSKCWPTDRFAQTADRLIDNYKATVVVSVSPAPAERRIAEEICRLSRHKLINLAQRDISVSELKSLFSIADLVISNDTGPRHIAIALQRKVIALFGPNDPDWTDTGYENEIKIIGNAPCAPCARAVCKKSEHLCMQAITVETVCNAAEELFEGNCKRSVVRTGQNFMEVSESFFTDPDYKTGLDELGLTCIDAVFSFNAGRNLRKPNLARHKSRLQFEISSPPTTLFLKRYDRPPILVQLKNWLTAGQRQSCSSFDFEPAGKLAGAGINTAKTISYGWQWGAFFEKRSFVITEKIANAESLERRLPDYFNGPATAENLKLRRKFITALADFVERFHATGLRHRDLYFSHIFYNDGSGKFYLIDLARVFEPRIFSERFRLKDIAQLHYSAAAEYFSGTDRLRFYLALVSRARLIDEDKVFIRKVISKANQMACHDRRHGRTAAFMKCVS
jgi:heptosyltransferase-2